MKDTQAFDKDFRDGLAAYQAKEFAKAEELFGKALENDPGNIAATLNAGLTQFQLGHKGQALGLFNRVLTQDPENEEAKNALKFVTSKLEIKEIPHRIEFYESFRQNMLAPTSLGLYLAVTAVILLSFGWFLIGWLGFRKVSVRAEEPPPALPIKVPVLGVLFVIFAGLSLAKIYDQTRPRGTIVASPVEVKSAPTANSVTLFTVYEGFEVVILSKTSDWTRINYPGGLTGWVPVKTVLDHNLTPL